jgi:hypothetical protein
MPFDLTNALSVFQHMMNKIFWKFLHQCVILYIYDISIFFLNGSEHKNHVSFV